ncbi:uncharacterized protein LOC124163271 isoform X1 [Ischnura elegans]|uniref:uncharacterized protein LOC124163271 isoform X1 n=1 Tax=Ischnura elegans TaxID=197161 RepID=UPI001ED88317|nr:uncharacterized protein LOC124163271 isoform X1 [Ischnura elegans]
MDERNTILPTCSRTNPLKGVVVSERCNVLSKAAELTSKVAEVIGSAFGPRGSAVLFARNTSSPNRSGTSPLISRTGLEMVEILAKSNKTGAVHPLLKSLVDSCRQLEAEWGDGVKSLVLLTHELLRNCSNLKSIGEPGWLRKELGKVLDFLGQSCDSSGQLVPPAGMILDQNNSAAEGFPKQIVLSDKVINASSSILPFAYHEVLQLLKMFFSTRFALHVVEVVPKLLCDWIQSFEKDFRCLEFMIHNFNSLCHANVGFPVEHSCLIQGILLRGSGVGHIFVSKGFSFHEGRCKYSDQNHGKDARMSPSDSDICNGCAKIKVHIITEHELIGGFNCSENQFELKANCLYLTSCIPPDLVKFKISQLGNVSVIHSVPCDDLDFLRYLIQDQKHFHSEGCDGLYVKWVRRWHESSRNPGLLWLGVDRGHSLALSVPIKGMEDGLKRSCYNALTLVHQFSVHRQHVCTKRMETMLPNSLQDAFRTSENSRNENEFVNKGKVTLCTSVVGSLPLNASLRGERLLSDDGTRVSVVNMIAAGGLAEVYLHDTFTASWFASPPSGDKAIDHEVAKAIALSVLIIPKSLSAKGKLMKKPGQPLAFTFNNEPMEMIAHRIGVVQSAVAVVLSLSNVSEVILISKSVCKSLSQSPNSDDSD